MNTDTVSQLLTVGCRLPAAASDLPVVRKTGPATEQGKAVVAWNARTHGIRSLRPVVPGLERVEDWQDHRESLLVSLAPVGSMECALAERVALALWRLNRVARYETEAISLAQESVVADCVEDRLADPRCEPGWHHPEDLIREAVALDRVHDLLQQLASLPDEAPVKSGDADRFLWHLAEQVGKDCDPRRLVLPAIAAALSQEDPEAELEQYGSWTAADVRHCAHALAAKAGARPAAFFKSAERALRPDLARARDQADAAAAELDRLSRQRILPSDADREKICRYEAHISRELYRALHELEAMQVRRSGGTVPLARVEVHGVPESNGA